MKNKKIYGLAGVAALAAIGGTFAYYTAEQAFNNKFDTSNYGTVATEQFNPGDGHDWVPGATVDKKIYATNTGEGDVWVRVKLDEKWTGLTSDSSEKSFSSNQDIFDPDGPETGRQANLTDGKVAGDSGSVVYKDYNYDDVSNDNTDNKHWYRDRDGYFYYKKSLAKGESTASSLLKTVTLCEDTDMGLFIPRGAYWIGRKDSIPMNENPFNENDGTLKAGWTKLDVLVLGTDDSEIKKLLGLGEDDPLSKDSFEGTKYSIKTIKEKDEEGEEVEKQYIVEKKDDNKEYYVFEEVKVEKAWKAENGQWTTTEIVGAEWAYVPVDTDGNIMTNFDPENYTVYTYKEDQLDGNYQGYANANYALDITVEFVQATPEAAISSSWSWYPGKVGDDTNSTGGTGGEGDNTNSTGGTGGDTPAN